MDGATSTTTNAANYQPIPTSLLKRSSSENLNLDHMFFSPLGFQSPILSGTDFSSPGFGDLHEEAQAAETLAELARSVLDLSLLNS